MPFSHCVLLSSAANTAIWTPLSSSLACTTAHVIQHKAFVTLNVCSVLTAKCDATRRAAETFQVNKPDLAMS